MICVITIVALNNCSGRFGGCVDCLTNLNFNEQSKMAANLMVVCSQGLRAHLKDVHFNSTLIYAIGWYGYEIVACT